jgi:hypothetical protein
VEKKFLALSTLREDDDGRKEIKLIKWIFYLGLWSFTVTMSFFQLNLTNRKNAKREEKSSKQFPYSAVKFEFQIRHFILVFLLTVQWPISIRVLSKELLGEGGRMSLTYESSSLFYCLTHPSFCSMKTLLLCFPINILRKQPQLAAIISIFTIMWNSCVIRRVFEG